VGEAIHAHAERHKVIFFDRLSWMWRLNHGNPPGQW